MAYSDKIKLVVGDTLPVLNFTLKDSNTAASGKTLDAEDNTTWAPVDISNGTVKLRIRKVGETTVLSTITASIVSGSAGTCTLAWPSGTWTAAGTYEGEIEFTTSGSAIQTVQDLIKFQVRDDFD
mgnify:FL=1|jgi:hypothetical protein|tara:strand:- start:405 stop:779 length:375 start_codon:yes stop_codon:yes gene_type:complete